MNYTLNRSHPVTAYNNLFTTDLENDDFLGVLPHESVDPQFVNKGTGLASAVDYGIQNTAVQQWGLIGVGSSPALDMNNPYDVRSIQYRPTPLFSLGAYEPD